MPQHPLKAQSSALDNANQSLSLISHVVGRDRAHSGHSPDFRLDLWCGCREGFAGGRTSPYGWPVPTSAIACRIWACHFVAQADM